MSQSSSQLPILVMTTQKSGEQKGLIPIHQSISQHPHYQHHALHHSKPSVGHHYNNAPNIIITNSTFNYRH